MSKNLLRAASIGMAVSFIGLTSASSIRAEVSAANLYKKNCVLCHAADGSGSTTSGKALKAKDLGSSEVQKNSDKDITEILTKGKGKMPAFGAKLKPEEITQLVEYVRTLAKK